MSQPLLKLARYARDARLDSPLAYDRARVCLMASLANAFRALESPACVQRLGPTVPGATFPGGARVPGTSYELEPVQAAFNIGALLRWTDAHNRLKDTERAHPSDNLGAILAVADYQARQALLTAATPPMVRDVLTAMITAYEIQRVIARDDLLAVRLASTAVASALLGGSEEQVVNALSAAFLDDAALRAVAHAPQARQRQLWAVADATSRGVRHALAARSWDFNDVPPEGEAITLDFELGSHGMADIASLSSTTQIQADYAQGVAALYTPKQQPLVQSLFADSGRLDAMPVQAFMAALVRNG